MGNLEWSRHCTSSPRGLSRMIKLPVTVLAQCDVQRCIICEGKPLTRFTGAGVRPISSRLPARAKVTAGRTPHRLHPVMHGCVARLLHPEPPGPQRAEAFDGAGLPVGFALRRLKLGLADHAGIDLVGRLVATPPTPMRLAVATCLVGAAAPFDAATLLGRLVERITMLAPALVMLTAVAANLGFPNTISDRAPGSWRANLQINTAGSPPTLIVLTAQPASVTRAIAAIDSASTIIQRWVSFEDSACTPDVPASRGAPILPTQQGKEPNQSYTSISH